MVIHREGVLRNLMEGALEAYGGDEAEPRRLVEPFRVPEPWGRVLVVDPDAAEYPSCPAILAAQGFATAFATDAASARAMLLMTGFDLVILETELPGEDGLALCKEICSLGLPVMIHSRRAAAIDRAQGLEFGADDYVDKACHPIEFLARVKALMRRTRGGHTQPPHEGCRGFEGWSLEPRSGALRSPGGRTAWLAPSEQALLQLFLDHPRELLPRERIAAALFVEGRRLSARVVDVRVVRLRRMLESCAQGGGGFIRTVRGGGYVFSPPGP